MLFFSGGKMAKWKIAIVFLDQFHVVTAGEVSFK